jgi:uncharacterized protein (DUF983 family)
MTCPRCRQGELFVKPMKLSRPLLMHKRCPVCGQNFEPEVGFYYGAMFISYVFIAFTSLLIVGTCVFLFKLSIELSFGILLVFLALIFIWNLRFSRSFWIHIIMKKRKEG